MVILYVYLSVVLLRRKIYILLLIRGVVLIMVFNFLIFVVGLLMSEVLVLVMVW